MAGGRVAARPAARLKERLQKLLARAGYGSRRGSEKLITAGRVTVNSAVVRELGTQADPDTDLIAVDGKRLVLDAPRVYLAMHKPRGFVTTARDPQGRRTVMELLPASPPHVLPVGRLDRDTDGLLLFTNDGELSHRLAHPSYKVEKEYRVMVQGVPSNAALERLRTGVEIQGRRTSPAEVEVSSPPSGFTGRDGHTWLRIVIREGRKRQVRLMCAAIGHGVVTLVRTRIGGIALGRLARGETRPLTETELRELRASVKLEP